MEQRTPEWFAARAGRVTGSQVGGLLGLSPHVSEGDAFRALVRSVHGMDSEFKGNVATEYGTFHESGALAEYVMETGNAVDQVGFVTHGDWLGASPDGLVGDFGLIEIKCPFGQRDKNPPAFKSIEDQPHYYAQIQVQLYCTGNKWCDFYQWSPHGTKLERVNYDPEWIGENLPKLHDLWKAAKDADPAEYEGPARKEYDTPEAAKLVTEYDELSEAIENATARKKDILARMVQIAGEKDAVIAGRKLTLVKRAGAVSYAKALAKYAPDADLEPFRGKPSEGWQLK
jgi:putative phage-type endonuclease